MITERTLRRWRIDALKSDIEWRSNPKDPKSLNVEVLLKMELNRRIIRLTQELLDQHLLRKE